MKEKYFVVNVSGGKDSTALLLHGIETGLKIDEAVCCDTYMEFPAMYRHIEKLKKVCEEAGIKFTTLRNPLSYEYLMLEHQPEKRNSQKVLEKYGNPKGYSWAGSRSRWCTYKLKVAVINKYFKALTEQYDVYHYIGLAADETYRLERESNKQENYIYPLVEWGWTEADCLDYCYQHGYDWEGLYKLFKRVSCWCCPLQSLEELKKLKDNFPDLWEKLKDMDSKTWRKFRADYSVLELEARFNLEDRMLAEGKSINPHNKEFRETWQKELERIRG